MMSQKGSAQRSVGVAARRYRAIPVRFDGVTYRSMQEARWAVVFKELGVRTVYEPEGFALSSVWYVPDFWLPGLLCFAEVKGAPEHWDELAVQKVEELSVSRPVLLLDSIDPLNWHVRVALPAANVTGASFCDVLQSILRARVWTEISAAPDLALWSGYVRHDSARPDPMDWSRACDCARSKRFDDAQN